MSDRGAGGQPPPSGPEPQRPWDPWGPPPPSDDRATDDDGAPSDAPPEHTDPRSRRNVDRGRRRRMRPDDYETELHYGEANRRRAREFLGLSESAAADRPGRRWARGDDDARPRSPRDQDLTGELPVPADMLGLTAESPGIAGQPLAPWMTGEHRAVRVDEPVRPRARDDRHGPGTEPPGTRSDAPPGDPRPGPSVFADPPAGTTAFADPRPGASVFADPAPVDLDGGRGDPYAAPPAPWPDDDAWVSESSVPPEPPITGSITSVGAPEPPEPAVLGPPTGEPEESSTRGSFLVAAGILLSRCAGLIREVVISAFLGTSPAADAFKASLRIPNLMQNLLGEGVLSASFIPVYARLRAEGRHEEAGRLAGAIAGLLVALTGAISLVGVLLAGPLTTVLAPGFSGDKHDLTVQLTRIMFPGIGFLVLSAWCLGVLNSHRQFFLSYVAPVLWNAAQIAALVVGVIVVGGHDTAAQREDLAIYLAFGVLIGGILQFGVQIIPVRRLLGGIHLSLDTANVWVRSVLGRFVPVLLGRGAIQIMGWVDLLLASYLATGAIAALTYTMVLYLLPVGLFGVSVAAAELPEMSEVTVHDPETRRRFRLRLEDSMARIAWYVAFTSTMFIVVGDVIVAAIFERGAFDRGDTVVVWLTLAVLSMGLLAVSATRLLQNGLYALDDARTPARLGVLGVVLSAVIGVVFMFPLDRLVVGPDGIEGWGDVLTFGPLPDALRANPAGIPHLGIVGLALGATISDWIEYRLLASALAWRIGRTKLAGRWLGPIALGCAVAAGVAFFAEMAFSSLPDIIEAVVVVGPAGLLYVALTRRLGVPEAVATVERVGKLARRVRR